MADNGVTCTTVGVATHGVNEDAKMKTIAEGTKDGDGKPGNFYKVDEPEPAAGHLHQGEPAGQPVVHLQEAVHPEAGRRGRAVGRTAPGLPDPLPRLHGFVRTTLKSNRPGRDAARRPDAVPDQRFPILAYVAVRAGQGGRRSPPTPGPSRASEQWWDKDWAGSDMYQKFWEQVVDWAMREAESGRLTLVDASTATAGCG